MFQRGEQDLLNARRLFQEVSLGTGLGRPKQDSEDAEGVKQGVEVRVFNGCLDNGQDQVKVLVELTS